MPEGLDLVYRTIDEQHADKSAATRRKFVAGAAATLGSMGLLGNAESPSARGKVRARKSDYRC